MLTLKCAKCNRKLMKYEKIGKGRILNCWKDRIKEDYTIRSGDEVKCKCGSLIGTDLGKGIKMKHHSFTYKETILKK